MTPFQSPSRVDKDKRVDKLEYGIRQKKIKSNVKVSH